MIDLIGMNGERIFIDPTSIIRFKYLDYRNPKDGTKIDYSSKEFYTKEIAEKFYERSLGMVKTIKFNLRAGIPVWINASLITEVRSSLPINGLGTEMLVGGHYQHVENLLDDVLKEIKNN